MVYTRTHTRYFAEDHLTELKDVVLAMEADLKHRGAGIDAEILHKAKNRLNILTLAVELCDEEAD